MNLPSSTFGKWTVLEEDQYSKYKSWICKCECGTTKSVLQGNLLRGKSISCGCHRKKFLSDLKTKHGMTDSNIYKVWRALRNRCYNKNTKDYANYGARGITVCDEWISSFENFYKWSVFNGYKQGLTIDRIDNQIGYSPDNCRWVSRNVQNNNKRDNHFIEINGVSKTVTDWAKTTGLSSRTIQSRLKYGWSREELIIPTKGRGANGSTARQ